MSKARSEELAWIDRICWGRVPTRTRSTSLVAREFGLRRCQAAAAASLPCVRTHRGFTRISCQRGLGRGLGVTGHGPGIIAAADQTGPDLPVAAVRVGRGRVLASLRRHCKIIAAMCAANSNLKLTLRG